jgi:hypothetical protein
MIEKNFLIQTHVKQRQISFPTNQINIHEKMFGSWKNITKGLEEH